MENKFKYMNKKTLLLLALVVPVLTMGAGCNSQTTDIKTSQTPVATVEPPVTTTNEFKLSDLKVGLEIAGLKVTSFGPFDAKTGLMSAENLTVSFEGTKTVTGIYSGTENSAMGGPATFSLDKASAQSLPRLASSNKANVFFSFSNLDTSAITKLGKVEKSATIVIKNYTINHWPAEVFNTAYLVEVTQSSQADLEGTIVREKNELFQAYDKISKDLSSGYPVIFSDTTNSAVRFTKLTNSGGDAMHTTLYFINQAQQKILQVDTDVYGGEFGGAGNLTLSLNGESTAVIELEKDVDDKRREITYKGLRVNEKTVLTFKNPIIFRPKGAIAFTVLGVSSDLTRVYFSEGVKQFSYDIASNKIQEITELPAIAKPVTK